MHSPNSNVDSKFCIIQDTTPLYNNFAGVFFSIQECFLHISTSLQEAILLSKTQHCTYNSSTHQMQLSNTRQQQQTVMVREGFSHLQHSRNNRATKQVKAMMHVSIKIHCCFLKITTSITAVKVYANFTAKNKVKIFEEKLVWSFITLNS